MKTLMRAAALGLVLTATASAPAALAQATAPVAADSPFRATTFNLSAYGETRVAPDMATITLGVMTEGKTAAEAFAALTPGRQKSWALFLNDAKTPATRLSRIEKGRARIIAGKGATER